MIAKTKVPVTIKYSHKGGFLNKEMHVPAGTEFLVFYNEPRNVETGDVNMIATVIGGYDDSYIFSLPPDQVELRRGNRINNASLLRAED